MIINQGQAFNQTLTSFSFTNYDYPDCESFQVSAAFVAPLSGLYSFYVQFGTHGTLTLETGATGEVPVAAGFDGYGYFDTVQSQSGQILLATNQSVLVRVHGVCMDWYPAEAQVAVVMPDGSYLDPILPIFDGRFRTRIISAPLPLAHSARFVRIQFPGNVTWPLRRAALVGDRPGPEDYALTSTKGMRSLLRIKDSAINAPFAEEAVLQAQRTVHNIAGCKPQSMESWIAAAMESPEAVAELFRSSCMYYAALPALASNCSCVGLVASMQEQINQSHFPVEMGRLLHSVLLSFGNRSVSTSELKTAVEAAFLRSGTSSEEAADTLASLVLGLPTPAINCSCPIQRLVKDIGTIANGAVLLQNLTTTFLQIYKDPTVKWMIENLVNGTSSNSSVKPGSPRFFQQMFCGSTSNDDFMSIAAYIFQSPTIMYTPDTPATRLVIENVRKIHASISDLPFYLRAMLPSTLSVKNLPFFSPATFLAVNDTAEFVDQGVNREWTGVQFNSLDLEHSIANYSIRIDDRYIIFGKFCFLLSLFLHR